MSGPTPLRVLRQGGAVDVLPLLWGNVAGSLGETSALLILLGGLFIIWKKAANWRIVVSELAAFVVLQCVFWLAGVRDAADPLTALLAGSILLGMFFMATDPVSASQTQGGRWIYGALIGCADRAHPHLLHLARGHDVRHPPRQHLRPDRGPRGAPEGVEEEGCRGPVRPGEGGVSRP